MGLVGLLALTAGGSWSALHTPGDRTRSVVQHVAAGTVFAGLTAEVLSRLLRGPAYPWSMAGGMALGLLFMMRIRMRSQRSQSSNAGSLAITIIADVLIDGVLMGLAIASGSPVAIVFVIALAPELTFLGLTLTEKLGGDNWGAARRIGMPALIGLGVMVGGVLGAWARSGPERLATGIEGFGAIALAYLVIEELLREAHGREQKPWIVATFFVGFIPFFIAAAIVKGAEATAPEGVKQTSDAGVRQIEAGGTGEGEPDRVRQIDPEGAEASAPDDVKQIGEHSASLYRHGPSR